MPTLSSSHSPGGALGRSPRAHQGGKGGGCVRTVLLQVGLQPVDEILLVALRLQATGQALLLQLCQLRWGKLQLISRRD